MKIEYRFATLSDMELLLQTRIALIEEDSGPFSEQDKEVFAENCRKVMEKGLKSGAFFAVLAFCDNTFAGTASVSLYHVLPGRKLPQGGNAYIQNVYVVPGYRRSGIGKNLIEMAVNEARRLGYYRITLHATSKGKLLFERCGFKQEEVSLQYMVYDGGK
jgi:GNAT superfamily N-acetyltransferase